MWWILGGAVVLVLIVISAILAWRVYTQATQVRAHLTAAMEQTGEIQTAVLAGDRDAAGDRVDAVSRETGAAVALVRDPVWEFVSGIPLPLADNLRATTTAVEVADSVASKVLRPVSSFDVAALLPSGGAVDTAALAGLDATLSGIDDVLASSENELSGIPRAALLDPVRSAITSLEDALTGARELITPTREVLSVLPDALGQDGARNYLLMFQGNSEARSLGGNAAVYIVLRAENGSLSIADVVNSSDFHHRSTPIVELDPEAVNIYTDQIGRYTPDFTMVPDFEESVRIFRGWWADADRAPFDAALSLDPVALSYILKATGPLELPTGDTLNAENAAPLLLNGVYYLYDDPQMQNAFFGAAAQTVFGALVSGKAAPVGLIGALTQAAGEGRLLYSSNDPEEAALLVSSPLSGKLPEDNSDQTVLGVFLNDNTGSKKSYYLDLAVDAMATCSADGSSIFSVSAVVTSKLSADEAPRLPSYITGPYFAPEDISSYLVLYGPVGGTLSTVSVDGAPASILSQGQHMGRPAVKVEVLNRLSDSHTVEASFAAGESSEASGPLQVMHTPMTRTTPVEIDDQACG